MRFIFNFIFWSAVLFFCGACFLNSPVGSRIFGKFFQYSGVDRTEKKAASNRARYGAARAKASDLSAAADDKLDAFNNSPLQQSTLEAARMNKAAEEVFRDKQDQLKDKLDRLRDHQKDLFVERKDPQDLDDKTDAVKQKLEAAEERAQAQRERAMAQKERLDN